MTQVLPFASPSLAARLTAHGKRLTRADLPSLMRFDPDRFSTHSLEAEGLLLDFSRQLVDRAVLTDLVALAVESGLRASIDALFAGEQLNGTERRAALHVALRATTGAALNVDGEDVRAAVSSSRARCRAFVSAVRAGERVGATGRRFTDIVNIGIGGSDLGPVMAIEALRSFSSGQVRAHFVSNIDGVALDDLIGVLAPETTLFIVCSKTFSTLETLTNARIAREWIIQRLGAEAVPRHFAAVSVNEAAMNTFGVGTDARFPMWDWVGGRYSMWSAIGLAVELVIGTEHFESMLAGASAIDEHFRNAPFGANIPVLMGLLGVWNRNFHGCATHVVLPYDQRLHRLPAYLQQLSMESNGKRVRRDGTAVRWDTEPVLWGEPGSNGQHSFFQLLHQGTCVTSADLLLPAKSSVGRPFSQSLAAANCLAQAEAFARGYTLDQATAELRMRGLAEQRVTELAPHKVHPGGLPSTLIAFERLDPATLGKLVATYEHKVFVESIVWDINAFDQWGVELGKQMAESLTPAVTGEVRRENEPGLQGLIDRLTAWRDA